MQLRVGVEGLVDALLQLAQSRGDEQVVAPAARRQLTKEVIQQSGGCGPAALRHACQRAPTAFEGDHHSLRGVFAHRDAAAGAACAAAVSGDALQSPGHMLRPGVGEPGVFEALRGDAQVQRSLLAFVHVGGEFAHHLDEPLLHVRGFGEAAARGSAHADVHERGHHGVVAGQTELLEVVERGRDALRRQAGDLH